MELIFEWEGGGFTQIPVEEQEKKGGLLIFY